MRRHAAIGLCASIVSLSSSLGAGLAAALSVPITVQPTEPPGAPNLPRAPEIVSVGVPLALADNVTDLAQLGFSGASAFQFRILQRYPDSRAMRWVLATFRADGAGSGYRLVKGAGNNAGAPVADDRGDVIRITTGAATFDVRKRSFNLLDRVVVGGREIVATHTDGGVVLAQGTSRFESAADASSQTWIEENGPVRAVICSKGVLRSNSGARHCGYTVRLQFDAGSSRCRAFVTLRNAEIASASAKVFDAAWVELPLMLGGARRVEFGLGGSAPVTGTLQPGASAHLLQGDNTRHRSPRTDRILPMLSTARGVEIDVGGSRLHAGGNSAEHARGWVRVESADAAVLAGMRDLAPLFPSGFDLRDDRLAVEVFSRHNPRRELVFSWGAHETREILFEFGSPRIASQVFEASLQWPLVARCDFERYRDTGAIFGETRLVSAAAEQAFFAELGHSWRLDDIGIDDIALQRQYSFSTTGGGNQFDQDLCHLIDFLRTGFSGQFEQARLSVRWKADQAVEHSDDFDYGERQNNVSDVDVAQPESFHGIGAGSRFDDEHPHWESLPVYYFLTGEEHVREAIEDYAEWRRYRAGHPTYGAIHGGALGHFRLWSRAFRDVALAFEFTQQPRYLADLRRMATALTQTIEVGTSIGRNLERGYFYFGDESDVERRIHLFFLTEINGPAAQEAMRVLPTTDPLREELRDYMSGLAWFTLQEAQISPDAIGYPYGYIAAHANTELGTRGDQTGMLLTHGYETSGDPEFIARARALAWRVLEYQSPLRGSELSTHVRIHRWLHRDEVGAVLITPESRRNPDGSFRLEWVAPEGAHVSIVKYGPRRLVENLAFDQSTRRYRHDPSTAMNFWAATNLAGEAIPAAASGRESFSTPPLPEGTWHFAVKVLLGQPGEPEDETPTTIEARDFTASNAGAGLMLEWNLSDAALPLLTGVHVERAGSDRGPWALRTTEPLVPAATMAFGDTTVAPGASYWYRLRFLTRDGGASASHAVNAIAPGAPMLATAFTAWVEPADGGPVELRYTVGGSAQRIFFEVFNVRGAHVRTLDQGWREPGQHTAAWDRLDARRRSVGRGVYFVRMRAGTAAPSRRVVIRHR